MRTVTYRLVDLQNATLNLGHAGENQRTRIMFDAKKLFEEYPAALPSLTVKPPVGDTYPAVVTKEGYCVYWDITDSDLIHDGIGEAQLTFTENDVKVKTYITKTKITRSLDPVGQIPTPIEKWIERADDILDEAQEAAAAAESAAQHQPKIENGYWYVWNGTEYVQNVKAQGEDGAPGQDGKDGKDGADGQPGADGRDGVDATPALITVDYEDLVYPVAAGTTCYHSGEMFVAKEAIQTAGAWDSSKWDKTTVEEQVGLLKNAIQGVEEEISDKANGIIKHISVKAETLFDSVESSLINPAVYGKTTQDKVFAYNITDSARNPKWGNDNADVSTMTVNEETGEVDIVVTAATAAKVIFKPYDNGAIKGWKFTQQEIAEIMTCEKITIDYVIDTSITSNGDLRPHFVWRLNGVIKTNESMGLANGTHTKEYNITNAKNNGFDELQIWWEIQRVNGYTLVQDDYFKLKKFEMKLDTTAHQYVINNSGNFVVSVGNDYAEIPYTLRGVPSGDGNITVNGIGYMCDYLDAKTGKIIRWIDSDIDNCIDNVVDYSDYILDESTEEDAAQEVCDAILSMKTNDNETEIDAHEGFVSFGYMVDTKKYIDSSSGQGFVTPEQYGAVGDGVTDDTEALRTMFNSGAEVIKLSDNKNYMVSEQIIIGGADELTIFGNGSTIKRIAGKLSELSNDEFVLSTDTESTGRKSITIQNIHICANASEFTDDVNSYGYNILPGLRIYGYDTVRLNGVEISDTLTGMGYLIQQAIHGIIENCYIHDIGQPWNVKVIFPNYMCGGGVMEIKNGAYVGSTLSIKNSRYERITASCHGSKTQYAEFIGNTYVECQDVIVEQTDTNPVDDVSVNKHRLMKNNHMIRCAHSLFSCSCAMSVDNDTTGKTAVIEGNVIEDAGDLNFYDLTSSPRTYTRVAKRMLALVNDNNNIKAPYEKVIIKNNYVSYADDLDEVPVVANVFSDLVEFDNNTIICPENNGNATIGSVSADGVIVENNNLFDGCAIGNVGIWSRLIADGNVFTYEGIIKDYQLGLGAAQNIMDIKNNKLLNDAKTLLNIKSNNGKLRMIGNTAKYLITSDEANCRGSGIVVDNVADTEFKDTTNTGSYSVTGTIAYTMS